MQEEREAALKCVNASVGGSTEMDTLESVHLKRTSNKEPDEIHVPTNQAGFVGMESWQSPVMQNSSCNMLA